MLYDHFREGVAAADPDKLPDIARALWKAFDAGAIDEAGATALSAAIEARTLAGRAMPAARGPTRVGSRPRSSESLERRRRWAASGYLPPRIAAHFTLAEAAALAVISAEVMKRGDCRLALDHVAALAGVARGSVKRALREARALGLVTVEERRLSRWRSDTNIVRIVDRAWLSWLALRARRPGGGSQIGTGTFTKVLDRPSSSLRSRPKAADGQGRSRAVRDLDRQGRG